MHQLATRAGRADWGLDDQMGNALHSVDFSGIEPHAGDKPHAGDRAHADEKANADEKAHARRLIALAADIVAIADDLAGPGQPGEATDIVGSMAGPDILDRRMLAVAAREAYRARRLRAQFFEGMDLFGEPGWDLLLDLFIAAIEGKSVPVTSACIGAAVPTTTALRWLSILETRGLVVRRADGNDARRVFVELTPRACEAMQAYFMRIMPGRRSDEPRLPFMLGK
ncbi:MAG: MarR family transcriptional regulator [Novosphingobium sp.]